jgi:hypothetical protein
MDFEAVYSLMDSLVLPFFGLLGDPSKSYLIGLVFLAIVARVMGEVSVDFLFRTNLKRMARFRAEADRMGELSLLALSVDDMASYEACNRRANENFSRLFYLSITMSAAALWPVFFALAWLQYRFTGRVEYHFILVYGLVYVIFKRVKPYLWKVPSIPGEELDGSILSDEEIRDMLERLKER